MQYILENNLKKQNKFLKYFSMAIQSLIAGFLLTILIAYIIGFRPVVVISGSMRPTLEVGDVIVIYKAPQNEIKVGDILTFRKGENGAYITHRIIEIDSNGDYLTQGDANDSPDGYVISYNQENGKSVVVGKTYYMLRGGLVHWLFNIYNIATLFVSIILLIQINNNSKEFFEKLDNYL